MPPRTLKFPTDHDIGYLKGLESLLCTIYNKAITDEQCKNISHLPALKELVLDSKSLSNAGLAYLTKLQNLESLSLMSQN